MLDDIYQMMIKKLSYDAKIYLKPHFLCENAKILSYKIPQRF